MSAPAAASATRRGSLAVVLGEYTAEVAYGLVHPEWRRSGATPEEERAALPGDELASGRELRRGDPLPRSWFACSWAFALRSEGAAGTRLLVRSRARYRPARVLRLVGVVLLGDTVVQRAMLLGIKRRAGAAA